MARQRRPGSVHDLACKIPVYGPWVRTDAMIGFKLMELQQTDAGDLNVGYVESGPAYGPVAVLLHGWPPQQLAAFRHSQDAPLCALRFRSADKNCASFRGLQRSNA